MDDYVGFLKSKCFFEDESGYFFKKIGENWLNCDNGIGSSYFPHTEYYDIIVSDSKGDDLLNERYHDFEDFRFIIIKIIREQRLKMLLD